MMESNKTILTQIERIYFLEEPPWAVALAGFIAKSVYAQPGVPDDVRTTFDSLNAQLIQWWPMKQPPLGDIYATKYDQCQNVYFSLDTENKALVECVVTLLEASLIQIRVLSFIESKLGESRPGIGNDVCEISAASLEALLSRYKAAFPPEKTEYLKAWIDAFSGKPTSEWSAGLRNLFASIGGPPVESDV